jgi:hypothetical protein
MNTLVNEHIQAAAVALNNIADSALQDEESSSQKSHGATFEAAAETNPNSQSQGSISDDGNGDSTEKRIAELLDQIGEGIQADNDANLTKLEIARKVGPLLFELKELCPHGTFKHRLKERHPNFHYTTPNRWMYVAKNEERVAAALEKFPDVAWGLKKMIDYLRGSWSPEAEDEVDRFDGNEDEYNGFVKDDLLEPELLEANSDDSPPGDEPTTTGDEEAESESDVVQFTPKTTTPKTKHQSHQVVNKKEHPAKATNKGQQENPASTVIDYEIEVRLGFKFSVPADFSTNDVRQALKDRKYWAVKLDTPFDNQISELGIVVSEVKPWDSPLEASR